jgi:hypothetical protein
VRGNHEEWLTRWVSGEGFDVDALSRAMGGAATLASYGVAIRAGEIAAAHVQVPEAHRVWLRALPVALDLEVQGHRYWLTHAGVPLSVPSVAPESVVPHLARHEPRLLLWPSVDPAEMPITGRTVIMGHRRHRAPIDTGNVLAVDTGAGLPGGKLTAVLLPSREFVTVG